MRPSNLKKHLSCCTSNTLHIPAVWTFCVRISVVWLIFEMDIQVKTFTWSILALHSVNFLGTKKYWTEYIKRVLIAGYTNFFFPIHLCFLVVIKYIQHIKFAILTIFVQFSGLITFTMLCNHYRYMLRLNKKFHYLIIWIVYSFFFFVFIGPHPQHMEVPRLGIELEL